MQLDSKALPYRVMMMEDASGLMQRLQAVYDAIYREQKADVAEVLGRYLLEEEYRHLTEYSQEQKFSLHDKQQLQEFIEALLAKLVDLELLTLRLAFRPRHEFVNQLVDWLKQNGPGFCRVQIVFDENIIGGLVMEYQGKIYDESLRKALEEITFNAK